MNESRLPWSPPRRAAGRPDGAIPTLCPFGHELGPGQTRVAWRPCRCATFSAQSPTWGHTCVTCLACEQSGWTMTYFRPEHISTAEEALMSQRWLRAALDRAEAALTTGRATGWQRTAQQAQVNRLRRALTESDQIIATRRAREHPGNTEGALRTHGNGGPRDWRPTGR